MNTQGFFPGKTPCETKTLGQHHWYPSKGRDTTTVTLPSEEECDRPEWTPDDTEGIGTVCRTLKQRTETTPSNPVSPVVYRQKYLLKFGSQVTSRVSYKSSLHTLFTEH